MFFLRVLLACLVVIAGLGAGLAGLLWANYALFVSPDMASWQKSGELMAMVILGGVGTLLGPVLGAAVYLSDGEAPMVTQLVEKPAPGTSVTTWNNAGFGVLPPEIWPYIERVHAGPSGEYVLPVAIADFVAGGGSVRAVPVEGPWFDVGTSDTLAAARSHYGGHA